MVRRLAHPCTQRRGKEQDRNERMCIFAAKRYAGMKARDADFYNTYYENSDEYRVHYSNSRYFPLWVYMEFLLRQYRELNILDIGCGSGQFGHFLEDRGYRHYRGIDFSAQAIAMAKETCGFPFRVADAFSADVLNSAYEVVVSMEVLEHIERDRELVAGIRPGTICLFTVPNFDSEGHVRFFKSELAVRRRYYKYLDIKATGSINRIFYLHAMRSDFNPGWLQRLVKTRDKVTLRKFLAWVKWRVLEPML